MDFLEKDLEEIICSSDRGELLARGLLLSGKLYRQMKIGNYGVADIVTVYIDKNTFTRNINRITVNIYELKQEKIGISAFLQTVRYAKGIEQYIIKKGYSERYKFDININLVGKKIDLSGEFCYINSVFSNVKFITYEYKINGILFDYNKFYSLINEGF